MWPDFKTVLLNAIKNHIEVYGAETLPRLRSATTGHRITGDDLINMIELDHPDVIDFLCVDVIGMAIRALGLRSLREG